MALIKPELIRISPLVAGWSSSGRCRRSAPGLSTAPTAHTRASRRPEPGACRPLALTALIAVAGDGSRGPPASIWVFRANVIHRLSPGVVPISGQHPGSSPHRCGQVLEKSMWTSTERYIVVHDLWRDVDCLLKVLGTTHRLRPVVVPRAGDKPRGYPVDSRWTTVDNRGHVQDCGRRPRLIPWLPTCESPVDKPLTSANRGSPQSAQAL
jgi:hypothetical protein